jgi:AcrR family transcriptional regulator
MQSNNSTTTRTQSVRRQDILEATVRIINQHGYSAASLDKIALEANISKGALLYHFKSKKAIMQSVLEVLSDNGGKQLIEGMQGVDDSVKMLSLLIANNLRFIGENADWINAIEQIVRNTDIKDDFDAGVSGFEALLVKGQNQGVFGQFDAHIAAITIRLAITGSALYLIGHPDLDMEIYAHDMAALLMRLLN